MGYNNQSTVFGYQGAGVNFLAIGKEGTMADLRVTGYGDSYEDGGITAVKLDIYGRDSGPKMIWVDADYGTDGTWYGWYNDGWDHPYDSESLAPGEGVWFRSPNSDIKIVTSGEVGVEVLPVTLIYGYQLCPNPTPIKLKMSQTWMSGYGDSYEDGGITAVKLDIYGRDSGDKMIWVDADYGTDGTWYGWYNDGWDDDIGARTDVAPGESMWVRCPTDGWMLKWPSAFNPDSNAEERAKK